MKLRLINKNIDILKALDAATGSYIEICFMQSIIWKKTQGMSLETYLECSSGYKNTPLVYYRRMAKVRKKN